MPGFLPNTDAALLAWSLNFSSKITATPTAFGLTAALATAYQTVHATFATALAACDPGERNKQTVVTKNTARSNLKTQARLLANLVEGTASVTPAQKYDLGLNVRVPPTPIPAPDSSPTLKVMSVNKWTVSIRLSDAVDSARRGRPIGTTGASVFSYVGPTPPSTIGDWKFEGNIGRTKFDVNFDNSLAPGTRVWLTAFWFNGRKQAGPACDPVATNLQGGSVAMAA
jgi:hypothetical protein